MYLLNIISADACGRSYYIAFAFMASEDEEDYFWVLSQLRLIYEAASA